MMGKLISNLDSLAVGTIGANIAALIALLVLFFWTATSAVFELKGKNDKDDRFWDMDLKFEEETTLKIVFNALILAIGCGSLFFPMKKLWHPTKGLVDRFNLGVLAASMFMFGNMLFISFWNFINFGQYEEKNNKNNNNYNDDAYNNDEEEYVMSEGELALYHRKIGAIVNFILALAFCSYSFFIYRQGKKLRETEHVSVNRGEQAQVKGAAHMEMISELWRLLSACTITIFFALYVTSCILLGGEEAEKMREDGYIFNLISVQMWVMVITTGLLIVGRKVLGDKKLDGTLGVGVLSGGTLYYAVLLFMVMALYADPALKDRKNDEEDGIGPAIATSFACFFLSLLYLAFALGTYKYQASIIGAISEGDFVMVEREVQVDDNDNIAGESAGDFKRMYDDIERELQVDDNDNIAGEPAGDFNIMESDESEVAANASGVSNALGDSKPTEDEPKKGPELEMV